MLIFLKALTLRCILLMQQLGCFFFNFSGPESSRSLCAPRGGRPVLGNNNCEKGMEGKGFFVEYENTQRRLLTILLHTLTIICAMSNTSIILKSLLELRWIFIATTSMIAFSDIEWLVFTNSFATYFSLDSIRRSFLFAHPCSKMVGIMSVFILVQSCDAWRPWTSYSQLSLIHDAKTYTNIHKRQMHMIQFIYKPVINLGQF